MQSVNASRTVGFDTSVYVNPKYYTQLKNAGYGFAVRYIWRHMLYNNTPNGGWPVALSIQELAELTDAGFGVSIVQFANPQSGFVPTAAEGANVGTAAGYNAKGLGIPSGTTIWCDVEFPSVPTSGSVTAYINAWATAVVAAGYEAGLYVGPNNGLSADAMYYDLGKINHYWKSASMVPWVTKRGFQMFQSTQTTLFKTDTDSGLLVDQDIVCFDAKNERFKLVMK